MIIPDTLVGNGNAEICQVPSKVTVGSSWTEVCLKAYLLPCLTRFCDSVLICGPCSAFSWCHSGDLLTLLWFDTEITKVKRTGPLDMFIHLLTSKETMCACSFCGHKVSLYRVQGVYTVWHSDSSTLCIGLHCTHLRSSQHSRVFVNILNLKPVSIFHW